MSNNDVFRVHKTFPFLILLILSQLFPVCATGAAENAPLEQGLSEAEVQTLQDTLAELKALGPKLRVKLRTLRKQVGFDVREIFNIERGMSQSEKDLERMIAMHQRNAFNKMRAHFMADDLRRKSEALKDSLAYVKRRIQELDKLSGDRQANAELKQNDDALMQLLGRYTELVSQSVALFKGKLI